MERVIYHLLPLLLPKVFASLGFKYGNRSVNIQKSVNGTISISAKDGLDSVTIGGKSLTEEALRAATSSPIRINTGEGILKITVYTSVDKYDDSGTISYTYTPTSAQNHTSNATIIDDIDVVISSGESYSKLNIA